MSLYFRTARTGGGTGALDALDGDTLSGNDAAIVFESGEVSFHSAMTMGSGESAIITVPDNNPGTLRWQKWAPEQYANSDSQLLVGAGEISATALVTEFSATGINLLTINSGEYVGQIKYICMVSGEGESNTGILSGNHFAGTSLVFGHDGDAAALIWTSDSKWNYLGAAQYTP